MGRGRGLEDNTLDYRQRYAGSRLLPGRWGSLACRGLDSGLMSLPLLSHRGRCCLGRPIGDLLGERGSCCLGRPFGRLLGQRGRRGLGRQPLSQPLLQSRPRSGTICHMPLLLGQRSLPPLLHSLLGWWRSCPALGKPGQSPLQAVHLGDGNGAASVPLLSPFPKAWLPKGGQLLRRRCHL